MWLGPVMVGMLGSSLGYFSRNNVACLTISFLFLHLLACQFMHDLKSLRYCTDSECSTLAFPWFVAWSGDFTTLQLQGVTRTLYHMCIVFCCEHQLFVVVKHWEFQNTNNIFTFLPHQLWQKILQGLTQLCALDYHIYLPLCTSLHILTPFVFLSSSN